MFLLTESANWISAQIHQNRRGRTHKEGRLESLDIAIVSVAGYLLASGYLSFEHAIDKDKVAQSQRHTQRPPDQANGE